MEGKIPLDALPDYVNFVTFSRDAIDSAQLALSGKGSVREGRLALGSAANKTATAYASAQAAMIALIARRQEQLR